MALADCPASQAVAGEAALGAKVLAALALAEVALAEGEGCCSTVSVMTKTVSVAVVLASEVLAGMPARWSLAHCARAVMALLQRVLCAGVAYAWSVLTLVTVAPSLREWMTATVSGESGAGDRKVRSLRGAEDRLA